MPKRLKNIHSAPVVERLPDAEINIRFNNKSQVRVSFYLGLLLGALTLATSQRIVETINYYRLSSEPVSQEWQEVPEHEKNMSSI